MRGSLATRRHGQPVMANRVGRLRGGLEMRFGIACLLTLAFLAARTIHINGGGIRGALGRGAGNDLTLNRAILEGKEETVLTHSQNARLFEASSYKPAFKKASAESSDLL